MARQAYAPTPLIRIVVQKENAGLFDARWFPARSLPAHFRCFPCGGLRRRTPGPPPFSSMNSTPAVSNARRRAASLASVTGISPSTTSTRRIVATPSAQSSHYSIAVKPQFHAVSRWLHQFDRHLPEKRSTKAPYHSPSRPVSTARNWCTSSNRTRKSPTLPRRNRNWF